MRQRWNKRSSWRSMPRSRHARTCSASETTRCTAIGHAHTHARTHTHARMHAHTSMGGNMVRLRCDQVDWALGHVYIHLFLYTFVCKYHVRPRRRPGGLSTQTFCIGFGKIRMATGVQLPDAIFSPLGFRCRKAQFTHVSMENTT